MTQFITHWVSSAGIFGIFVLMTFESCGIPIASEVTMPLAGYLAATGSLSFAAAVLAGTVGNLVGSSIAYWLAARFGEPLLLGPGKRVGISATHLELADRWFQRWGLWAVLGGRVLPVIRTYISFPAGLARVRAIPFALLTFVGSLPWCLGLAWGGYTLGKDYNHLAGPIEKLALGLAVLIAALVVWWFVHGRHLAARRDGPPPEPSASQ